MLFRNNVISVLPFLAACSPVFAQESTTQDASPKSSAPPDPSPWPTVSVFLPGSLHFHELPGEEKNWAASVITANENQTAYAIGCIASPVNASTPARAGACGLPSSITVTGGESTLIYTYNPIVTTDDGMPGTSKPAANAPSKPPHSGATINCNLVGGSRATAATCTSSSQIPGLGLVGSSSTLASTQIDYATLTVTAGREMLVRATGEAGRGGGQGNEGGGGVGESGARGGRVGGEGMVAVFGIGLLGLVIGLGVL